MEQLERIGPWLVRSLWVALALVSESPLAEALDGRSTAVRVLAAAGLWAGWATGFGALLVPRSSALTVSRVLVPCGLAAVGAALVTGASVDARSIAAIGIAALAVLAVLAPWIGEWFVDGSSYGPEHRLPLRPPATFAVVVVPFTWAVTVAGAVTGPLLLASGRWVIGVIASVAGLAVTVVGSRALHQLTRRWVVLVPNGLVLHDGLTMPEPQLFPRPTIRRLGPAPADTDSVDLTAGAPGLALQLDLNEPIEMLLRERGRDVATVEVTSLLLSPTRPARLLQAAAKRRIPIG